MKKLICPLTGVNIMRFLAIIFAGFVFVFAFDFGYHAILLEGQYMATAHLWRPQETMEEFFLFAMLCQLAYIIALAFVFTRHYEGKGIGEGVRFGLAIGGLLGVAQFGIYPYLPIPFTLAALWAIGTVVQITGLGIIFALVYRK
ncbi:MAG: hypothetical protein ACRBCK_02130 [Alphaproteobacteria bacterium]